MKDEKHITLGQLSRWKNRAFSQAERAQWWFAEFRTMIETASEVSVDGKKFLKAELTLDCGANAAKKGDVVILELISVSRCIVIRFIPRFKILSDIKVDESYWPDGSSTGTLDDILRDTEGS